MPNNLHRKLDKRTGKTYYTYRNPQTGKTHGLGTDAEAAQKDALALNSVIYASIRSATLAAIVTPNPTSGTLLSTAVAKHLELCKERGWVTSTINQRIRILNIWMKLLGADRVLEDIAVRDFVVELDKYKDRPRTAQIMRLAVCEVWADAMQEGWTKENIPSKTRKLTSTVKRSRLSLDDFKKIHAAALTFDPWIARSMELALVTCQRREDIQTMEFNERKGSTAWIDGDYLFVIQIKTKNKVRIPMSVGLNGWMLNGVIKSCRDLVMSKWLIHFNSRSARGIVGNKVSLNLISEGFAKARVLAGVTGEEGKTPPTFHEIRSLSVRLYKEKHGAEFAQAIAGHKDASTSALYQDVRGSEWVQVKV